MPPADVSRLLSRIANDEAFRALLATDPDTALSGYDLSPDEARRFSTGGPDALSLLTWEARGQARPASKAPGPAPTAAPLLHGQPLPQVEFLLEITPTAQPGPDGTPQIAHMAALHMPDAHREEMAGVLFRLRIAPLARPQPDGSLHVSYTAAIEPISADLDPTQRPDTRVPTAPWGHDTESPAARTAADAVRAAAPGDRHAALLDLIAVVTGGKA